MSDIYLVRHCAPTLAGIKPEACSPVPMDTVLLSMYNNSAMTIMDTRRQLNNLAAELGGNNLGETVGETEKATHGEDASWETIINLNPRTSSFWTAPPPPAACRLWIPCSLTWKQLCWAK